MLRIVTLLGGGYASTAFGIGLYRISFAFGGVEFLYVKVTKFGSPAQERRIRYLGKGLPT